MGASESCQAIIVNDPNPSKSKSETTKIETKKVEPKKIETMKIEAKKIEAKKIEAKPVETKPVETVSQPIAKVEETVSQPIAKVEETTRTKVEEQPKETIEAAKDEALKGGESIEYNLVFVPPPPTTTRFGVRIAGNNHRSRFYQNQKLAKNQVLFLRSRKVGLGHGQASIDETNLF